MSIPVDHQFEGLLVALSPTAQGTHNLSISTQKMGSQKTLMPGQPLIFPVTEASPNPYRVTLDLHLNPEALNSQMNIKHYINQRLEWRHSLETLLLATAPARAQMEDILDLLSKGETIQLFNDYDLSALQPAPVPTPTAGVPTSPTPGTSADMPDYPDDTAARSGYIQPPPKITATPVTLRRYINPLTGDVALWLLIKRNAEMLSWDNYASQMDLLFFNQTASKSDLSTEFKDAAGRLSHRRFLPFTDTDAYRTLKVATEAFVMTWGGVVPLGEDRLTMTALLKDDPRAVALAQERLGVSFDSGGVNERSALIRQYFSDKQQVTPNDNIDPTLPYLHRVVAMLQGTASAEVLASTITEMESKKAVAAADPTHHALWLAYWNENISAKLAQPPLIELIWSYWHEEMQLVQTTNAIMRRYQNVASGPNDPLAAIEMDPLRNASAVIWGFIQDEQHRLPIERRASEYAHEYGFRLFGKAVPPTRAADDRSKFIEAFHTLLNLCVQFFRQADDTTVVADGFPLLNALRETHLILSEGSHNQFRDLPTTSRIEMMMQQWLLARPEFREFLPRRAMVAYPEPWMHSVESMRKLQGWGDTNTYQFWQLATNGEQILSSIRWGDWNSINDPANAANWATFFRPEIQTYIHAYRAVTGVDVSTEPLDTQVPGMHLMRRMSPRAKAA